MERTMDKGRVAKTSTLRSRRMRSRRKQGVLRVIGIEVTNDVAHMLSEISYVTYPCSPQRVAESIEKLLATIQSSPEIIARLKMQSEAIPGTQN